jgi:UDP-GlcNAc:undecaprenyl-phosphate GlcNAc-1-phosphate transferase
MRTFKAIGYVLLAACVGFLFHPAIKEWFYQIDFRWGYLLAFSFLVCFLTTPLVRGAARRLKVLDLPDSRKMHLVPTALLGGVAVAGTFSLTLLYNFNFSLGLKGVVLGAGIIFFSGLIDDVFGLPAGVKLFVQIVATYVLIRFGVAFGFFPKTILGTLANHLLTFLWVIGITNAMNFFDGMDGLATGVGIIASFFFSLVAIQTGQHYMMYLSVALLGSCLGFLPYNFKPRGAASIFLGDTGSTFIGFTLAGLAILGEWAANNPLKALSTPLLILGVLVFDMIYLTVTRIASGRVKSFREWIGYVGRDHLHHRLENLGLSKKQSVLFIFFLMGILGLDALLVSA